MYTHVYISIHMCNVCTLTYTHIYIAANHEGIPKEPPFLGSSFEAPFQAFKGTEEKEPHPDRRPYLQESDWPF